MNEEIVIAGFGGQGVLSLGKIIAYSGIFQGLEVSWMPSYGPEMRGGTANVTVIISDHKISSPVLNEYDTAILLNQQSVEKFEPMVKPGGVLLYDLNGIKNHPYREDINIYSLDAVPEAGKIGSVKTFNMIVFGAFLSIKPVLDMKNIVKGLEKSLPERYHKLIPLNEKAIKRGMEIVNEVSLID